MRIRATVVAVTGAVALSALAVPAAQATGSGSHNPVDTLKALHAAASGKSAFTGSTAADTGKPYPLDAKFGNVRINNGKPIVASTGGKVTAPVTFTVTHGAGVDVTADDTELDLFIYRGAKVDDPDNLLIGEDYPACTNTSATVATCKGTIDIFPGEELENADATTWKAAGYIVDWNDVDPSGPIDWTKVGSAEGSALAATKLQRLSKLTVNAAPEPVKKGRTITVTGRLTRANWDTGTYTGYAGVYAQLQFRKKGATTYSTVKSVKTTSTGGLATTVKAGVDGYYRYSFVGTTTSPAAVAAGDFVDVK
ncbi:hypothetical protein [Streptomyces soliscabiei]|uniref:hypothetical protein n=1 Tax=Streptomyces soliscabiei TaxID=588897 RepID=UPI0029AD78C4|nr:hypothetical protein [Streptomyces sp. NY05-11A]MDX2678837.1 hypothetical protein [Streptomyces sp. NY05-11A]